MTVILLVALAVLALAIRFWDLPRQLEELKGAVAHRWAEQATLRLEVKGLREELTELRALVGTLSQAAFVAQQPGESGPVAVCYPPPTVVYEPPVAASEPALPPSLAPTEPPAPAAPAPAEEPEATEAAANEQPEVVDEEVIEAESLAATPAEQPQELEAPAATELAVQAATDAPTPAELPTAAEEAPVEVPAEAVELEHVPTALLAPHELGRAPEEPSLAAPVEQEEPAQEPMAEQEEPAEQEESPVSPAPAPAAWPTPPAPAKPPQPRLLPPPARRRAPKPVPTGPTWWEKAATMVLENWTGVLGAVVLVTGVGFLGIYAALRLAPPFRFLLICAFAVGLLGARYALRNKQFAKQLNAWLLSSAAAIFLFACVGAVSISGLQWATPPFDYLLLLAGVSANLYLAWRASRETVATLHGVLSLVALAVLPPTGLTLGAAAGVTAFSIAITYRQQWKYQLLLSIASFFAFHLYWHQELATIANGLRLTAMALVLLVGGAAAVVQYRRVYAERRFEPLLFTAHLLNWTCLGINLYLHSTGSVWKTIPLALGALLTFWAGRQAKKLGIGWLFQTDTIISLILALATALSLQGWHATNTVILLFMLLESLLVALVMARQREALVYRVAMAGALLAGGGLLLLAGVQADTNVPTQLYRDALVLVLAGSAALAFTKLIYQQPLLQLTTSELDTQTASAQLTADPHHFLLQGLGGLAGLLQAGTGLLLARALFAWPHVPVGLLLVAQVALAGGALGLAAWVRAGGRTPNWVRWQQLVLGQFFVVLALVGLHEVGLSWSVVLLVLFAENLLVLLFLAGRDPADQLHGQVYRVALAEAFLTSTGLLLVAGRHVADHEPTLLYREALLLALAGWVGVGFVQLAFKLSFLQVVRPALRQPDGSEFLPPASNQRAHQGLVSGFAGLAGLLQIGAGALLGRALFGWQPAPVGLLLMGLVGLASSSLALAYWVRTLGVAPDWVRRQQLVLGQLLLVLAVFGLHELGLSWPGVLIVLYLETLLAVLLLAGRDGLLHRAAMVGALAAGASLLLLAGSHFSHDLPTTLYRDALLLALAGWASIAFVQLTFKQLLFQATNDENNTAPAPHTALLKNLLHGFASLAGLLQVGTGALLARALFAWPHVPEGLLIGAMVVLAGLSLGLNKWLHTSDLSPNWMRRQQLVLAQFFMVLAVFGLHEIGLGWSSVVFVLFAENLLVALLLAGHDGLLHRAALVEALLVGASLLAVGGSHLAHGLPPALYHNALLLALAGWASIAFIQFTFKQLRAQAIAKEPATPTGAITSFYAGLLHGFGGLAGLLQVGTGALLARVLFGWQPAPVGLLLVALGALAGISLGLAYGVRGGLAPDWLRRQQLVLAQFFVVLAIVGLHELRLSWSGVFLVLYLETLLAALLLAGRDKLLHRAAMLEALATGTGLLLVVGSHLADGKPGLLYREALLLALAGWASIAFIQFTPRRPFSQTITAGSDASVAPTLPSSWLSNLLGGFAGLAGFLQAGAGLLLAQVLFGWSEKLPILLLLGLAGAALGLAYWVHARGQAPRWVRRQQLVLAQVFTVLAVVGLHKAGLSWPGVLVALYAESLLAALLLSGRDEDELLHIQTYLLVLQAGLLPVLVRATAPSGLPSLTQASLLLGAALLTLGYQARQLFSARMSEDYARLPLTATARLPLLSVAIGWLLLGAGSLEYTHAWAGWAMVGLLAALLYLRQRAAVPGLWAALVLAATGYVGLQWAHVLSAAAATHFAAQPALGAGHVLLYLLPTLAVPGLALLTSQWPVSGRYLRGPWLYMLGLHLVVALLGSVPPAHHAYLMLGLLALAGTAFAAAQTWRRALPDATAVDQAGRPDRYLLHLSYGLLVSSLLFHLRLLAGPETLFHQPAEYFTAAAFFGVLAAMAIARPPATAPVYTSWRVLHPWLPEAALLFGTFTLAHNLRAPWLPLIWIGAALVLSNIAAAVPPRFRRLGLYGRLYYWLAALSASATCLLYVSPTQLLSPEWWALTTAVALLFGYVGLALRVGNEPYADLSPAWNALAQLPQRQLEALLLYPAFVALSLLFIQSFDRSVLTVLLMLEVVAVFSTSLLLRRQDLRYVALAGMVGCLVRLVFFDLSRSGTITRAIVFIFMGLLLLGMNALYARFKARFEPELAAGPPDHLEEDEEEFLPNLPDEEALAPE
ncbi:hypothetical protein GO988_08115 [Hymenobacter sp. HMF4947]|uniref:DUF2339 domain-containing protein n=1 Tax=Hymenobacter ginkgonis TaxID=2682976 RepID=A0A7K1TD05_9BACT|nr:hypothetical protein [Hymenobacter ginkgonis]MVN76287.1 hypothetical protein [Hymenobacter ginkgonis]